MATIVEFALSLLVAHALGDFVLQTQRMVQGKDRWPVLGAHAGQHAILAYLLAGRWHAWTLPLLVLVTHALIDRVKAMCSGRRVVTVFLLDQLAHMIVIACLTLDLSAAEDTSLWGLWLGADLSRVWVVTLGVIVCVRVAGILIGYWVRPYLQEIEAARGVVAIPPMARGLTNGGRTIGQWERALIFFFVLLGQPAGVGFLVAAKSIFRFGELKDRENRMEAEYITIGTLMSFGWALAVAYLTLWVLGKIS